MKKILKTLLYALPCLAALTSQADEAPRLVVQIVIGSMRADAPGRYDANFGDGGFRRLRNEGTSLARFGYGFQQTLAPATLSTLATGAQPSTHGVVSSRWREYVENQPVALIADAKVSGLDARGHDAYSPRNLIAPTLAESLLEHRPESRAVAVALDAQSAVVMNGRAGHAYWLDSTCRWASSTYYMPVLPEWVKQRNRNREPLSYLLDRWTTRLTIDRYLNRTYSRIEPQQPRKSRAEAARPTEKKVRWVASRMGTDDHARICCTPAGNTAVLEMAKTVVAQYRMGEDRHTDLLNICLDAPRRMAEIFGPESVEVEDMYYRLDDDLADFLSYLYAQVPDGNLVVVVTSDHGTSPSFDASPDERGRFNVRQFEVILNGFLSARYGAGQWVLEYNDGSIYLNHNLVYENRLDLSDVQDEAAAFSMQFRGVSHALTASSLRSGYFGSGYGRLMQNSFYPRRSGDLKINLMPGWIEETEGIRSASGSLYGYDRYVPLYLCGKGIPALRIDAETDAVSLAPTLARLMGIGEPAASEGSVITEIIPQ